MIIRHRNRVRMIHATRRAARSAYAYARVYTNPRLLDVILKFKIYRALIGWDEQLAERWFAWSGLKAIRDRGRAALKLP